MTADSCFPPESVAAQSSSNVAAVRRRCAAALAGRPLGILLAVAVAVGLAAGLHLPVRIGWRELVVVAFAASIGFAFSLLVATQAFGIGPVLIEVKIGALLSLCGAVVALALAALLRVGKFAPRLVHGNARA